MRLIDADELINQGYEIVVDGLQYDTCNKSIDIDTIPTAYDLDKVVEELEVLKRIYFLTIANTGDEKSDFAYENVGNALDKAIEIVKQGDVSDDVCKWIKQYKTYDWKPSCETNSVYNVAGVGWFKYCPYCGKKIKVVE